MCIISNERMASCAQVEGTRGEIFPASPIALQSCIISKQRIAFARRKKEREERFSQRHPSHCNPDASMYPMNPFRRIVTVSHNARVIV